MHRQDFALVFAAACAVIVAAAGAPPQQLGAELATSASAAPITAEAIYLRTMRAMRALPQPKYVIFRADYWARNAVVTCADDGLSLSLHHGDFASAYRVWYRVADEVAITVDPKTRRRCADTLIEPAGTQIETLGQASPSPTPTGRASENQPRIIGAVRVESVHFYRVTLAGTETVDGHETYHLALHAYAKPLEHPLTDLWIDTASSLIRRVRAEVSIHLVIASAHGAFVGSFDRYGPYWILDSEHIDFAGNAAFVHVHPIVNIRASDFSFPEDLPGVFPSPSPSPSPRK